MKNWALSAVPLKNATFAAIFLFALLIQSCGGTKETTDRHTSSRDSMVWREISQIRPLTVPLTRADLRLDLKEISNLTPGAVFTDKNGQASVRVERRDSIIYITAQCDSLQVLCESKTREIYHLRTQLEQQHTQVEKPPGWWATVKNNTFYIAIGMVLMALLTFIKKIWKKIKQPGSLIS